MPQFFSTDGTIIIKVKLDKNLQRHCRVKETTAPLSHAKREASDAVNIGEGKTPQVLAYSTIFQPQP